MKCKPSASLTLLYVLWDMHVRMLSFHVRVCVLSYSA